MTSSLPTFRPHGQASLPPSLWPASTVGTDSRPELPPLRARGHFVCDASLRALTIAPWFAQPGRRTEVTMSIRRCGAAVDADTTRGAHALSARFARPAGPGGAGWQLEACSLPLCLHARVPAPWQEGAPLSPWLWLMSDRALPRSYRMMQGFGVRTYRLRPTHGAPVFARFHWLPAAGTHALAADEAEQLAVADPQFLRRDFRDAIAAGATPAWTLALQVFSERQAAQLGVDPHDPGPLLPADCAPLRSVGRLVLDALDQSAHAPVPAGTASFEEAPGIEPCPLPGTAWPDDDLRQARLFWCSQSGAEQQHLAAACRAACVALPDAAARERLWARLAEIDPVLALPLGSSRIAPASAAALPRMSDEVPVDVLAERPAAPALQPAPMLSLMARPGARSVRLRRVAILLAEGFEGDSMRALQRALRLAGARPQCVGMHAGAFRATHGGLVLAEASLESSPSVLWDAVVLPAGQQAQAALAGSPEVARFVQAQYRHGKPILQLGRDHGLLARLGIPPVLPDGRSDPAVVRRTDASNAHATRQAIRAFLEALSLPRRFDRGPACEPLRARTAAGSVAP
jgi:putative intracellular protease/amidase